MRLVVVFAATACALACGQAQDAQDYSSVVPFDSAVVRVVTPAGSKRFHVQIARSAEQRTMGLMERTSLADTAGMLFLYDGEEPATSGFWMFRTRIPLDIAFMDSTGRIVAIREMAPCAATLPSGCPSYEPGVPYRAALEVKAGILARNGIGIGARMELPGSGVAKRP